MDFPPGFSAGYFEQPQVASFKPQGLFISLIILAMLVMAIVLKSRYSTPCLARLLLTFL